jgi:hypothetical protein
MKRFIVAAAAALLVLAATLNVVEAKGRPAGAGAEGIQKASSHMGPVAAGKITLSDILITGRPRVDPGGSN